MKHLIAAGWLVLFCANCLGGEKVDPEKKVREGIIAFRKAIRSEDEKVRQAAYDRTVVDRKLTNKLFGRDAELAWKLMAPRLKLMRENTAAFKKELDGEGKVKKITLHDVRKRDLSFSHHNVLKLIPAKIPIFTAVLTYERRTGGSGSYLLVDGRMRWFPAIELVADHIVKTKAAKVTKGFKKLAGRLLAAMRSGKSKDAVACWVSEADMLALLKKAAAAGREVPSAVPEPMKAQLRARDVVVRKWFTRMVAALKAWEMDPKDLECASTEGKVESQGGFSRAETVTMIFMHKSGAALRIRIDGGMKLDDGWRFGDKPIEVAVITGRKSGPVPWPR
jgi:hypothetical protein